MGGGGGGIDRQTDRDIERERRTDRDTEREREGRERRTDGRTDRQTDRQTETERQTERQRQTERRRSREAGGETDRHRETEREREEEGEDVGCKPVWLSGKASLRLVSGQHGFKSPVSNLPSLQTLWFLDSVFRLSPSQLTNMKMAMYRSASRSPCCEPVWPSGKALGW